AGLEVYLLRHRLCNWIDSFAFRDFLRVPAGEQEPNGNSDSNSNTGRGGAQFMSSTWLEHMDLQARVRDVGGRHCHVNWRDAFSDRGGVGTVHGTNVQAKKLAGMLSRRGSTCSHRAG
ncbi:hypothetical protein EDB83DRAFT_2233658, partial [Lactarius deliciosus]